MLKHILGFSANWRWLKEWTMEETNHVRKLLDHIYLLYYLIRLLRDVNFSYIVYDGVHPMTM
jgi:hypothetical protein